MRAMFDSCHNLTLLDLSNFDTSNVTDMSEMFCNCDRLRALELSNFDTSHVIEEDHMFFNCFALNTVYVGDSWDINNIPGRTTVILRDTGEISSEITSEPESYINKETTIAPANELENFIKESSPILNENMKDEEQIDEVEQPVKSDDDFEL